MLDRDDAAIVDKVWSDTFYAVNAWLYEQNAGLGRGNKLPDKIGDFVHTLSVKLAAMLTTAANPADALVRLRAVQAATVHHGLLLHHEPPSAQFPRGGELGCQLTPALADAINRNVSTAVAAAATIDLIYPMESSEVRYPDLSGPLVAVNTIAQDGSRLRTPHGQIAVPPQGQPALRAHLHRLRAARAADPDRPFFGTANRAELARTALQPLVPQWYQPRARYRRSRATVWMLRRGLELEALPSLASYERPYRWMVG
ncbi:hypothetical protein [Salinispora arenicola]|uniref:hypothetical protein n=1 Tax=Salinispora arenicola TaxID=168697 RepID=UPI0003621BE5|nr:hypothetical protein [Salinispora arenicola]